MELGNNAPYDALIHSDQPLENLAGQTLLSSVHKSASYDHTESHGVGFTADINTPTCRNCKEDTCEDNILPELQLLTSGYFSLFSSGKPAGNSKTSACCSSPQSIAGETDNASAGCKTNAATVDFSTGQAELSRWGASTRTQLDPVMACVTPRRLIWPFWLQWICWRRSEWPWETGDSCSKRLHNRNSNI